MQATGQSPTKREVFAKLYDEFMPKVFRYISYRITDRQTTEDLTSLVFEKALVSFDKYSSDMAAFSTWIFSIARNTLIDHYRTNKAKYQVPLDETGEEGSGQPSLEEEIDKKMERECLRVCLAKLPEEDQEIIRLKFGAQFNNRQIAAMLGLSESNVGVRLFRTIKKLREDFNES